MNCKHTTCPLVGISLIPLTQGKYAIVDTEDYEYLTQWKWYAQKFPATYYARRFQACTIPENGRTMLSIHRIILNVPKGMQTDHRNHNGLDNRKCNLRTCSHRENEYNQLRRTDMKSKYKGVDPSGKRWKARIRENGKQVHLGCFGTEKEAAKAYDAKANELFGDFACTNF